MLIHYNKNEKLIEINDRMKNHIFMMNFVFTLNLISAVFQLITLSSTQWNWMGFIWLFIGGISVYALIHYNIKKTGVERIKIKDINSLESFQFLGVKKCSLKLKNGKTRDLINLKHSTEATKTVTLFNTIGIKNNLNQ